MEADITYYETMEQAEITYSGMERYFASRNIARMRGNRLKEIRNAKGLKQAKVAERMDVSTAQISRWESGTDNIPSVRIPEMAVAYECTMGEIFDVPPTEADYEGALENVRRELPPDASFGDFLTAAAASVRRQIELIQSERANHLREELEIARGKVAPPHAPTRRVFQG